MKRIIFNIRSNTHLHLVKIGFILLFLSFTPLCTIAQETVVLPKGSTWKYLDTGTYPGDSWMTNMFNDDQWGVGTAKLGYGEGNESTQLSYGSDPANKYISYYFRTTFEVEDPNSFQSCMVRLLRDDGAVVYLNGVKVVVSNMPETVNYLTLASVGVGGQEESTYFDYYIASEALQAGTNVIAVEVHQSDPGSSDLGFDLEWSLLTRTFLSLRINEVMSGNHSNNVDPDYNQFVDWIELYNGSGNTIDLSGFTITDNLAKYNKWTLPSGQIINAGGHLLIYADKMENGVHTNFSLSSTGERVGIFDPDGNLVDSLSYPAMANNYSYGYLMDDSQERGYFTFASPGLPNVNGISDGTLLPEPQFSKDAGFYTGILTVTLTCSDPAATIRYTRDGSDPVGNSSRYTAPLTINGNVVIKARAFKDNRLASRVVTSTYFINESISIPFISISMDDRYLSDEDVGIYKDNRLKERKEWKRPATMEFFEPNGELGFRTDVDLRLFGRGAVTFPMKSFGVFIRSSTETPGLNYQLFPDSKISHYDSFILRSSSDDWRNTLFKDGFNQSLVEGLVDIEQMNYRPSVVFMNGEFLGIHNIRDKYNEAYLISHFAADVNNVDLLYIDNDFAPPNVEIKAGDDAAYWAMWNFISKNDMTISENYAIACNMMEINCYADYMAVEILVANRSWLHNRRIWRPRTENGKFRYILQDTDYGFYDLNSNVIKSLNDKDKIFISMVKNPEFRNLLLNRLTVLSQTAYQKDRAIHFIDSLANQIDPYIERHTNKWKGTLSGVIGSKSDWEKKVENVREFARGREDVQNQYFENFFNLNGQNDLNVTVQPSEGGKIFQNGKLLTDDSFSGKIFDGTPLTLRAEAYPGYQFTGWQGMNTSASTIIPKNSTWKYKDDGTNQGTAWKETGYSDNSWSSGSGILGYGDTNIATTLSYGSDSSNKYTTYYFRKSFNLNDPSGILALTLQIIRDDGAIVYINGQEVVRSNMPTGTIDYQTFASSKIGGADEMVYNEYTIPSNMLVAGTNVIAVEIHQESLTSADISFDLTLMGQIGSVDTNPELQMSGTSDINLVATFSPIRESSIVISEIMYAPSTEQTNGFEFIEITNAGRHDLNIKDYYFSGIDFTFPSTVLKAGEYAIIAANSNLFGFSTSQVFNWTGGNLSDTGETIRLFAKDGSVADQVAYGNNSPWPTGSEGSGFSIELIDPQLDNGIAQNWKKSSYANGSAGARNPQNFNNSLKINEISGISGSSGYLSGDDWIEIVNTGNQAVDLGGMYLSDDPAIPQKFQIPIGYPKQTTVQAGGYIVFTANSMNYLGPLYTNFKLSSEQGSVLLVESAGDYYKVLDQVDYSHLIRNTSYGRLPNVTGEFTTLRFPTPNSTNRQLDLNIIAPYRVKDGDWLPIIVKITDANGQVDRTVNGAHTLSVSSGSLEENQIRIHYGMGALVTKINANQDFNITLDGYSYSRFVVLANTIPTVELPSTIDYTAYLASGVDYIIPNSIDIPVGGNLIVQPGARLIFGTHKGISANGRLAFNGSADMPIVIMPEQGATWWGGIELHNMDSLSTFQWMLMTKGGGDDNKIKGHAYVQPLFYGDHARFSLDHVYMAENKGKGIYTDYSEVFVNNSLVSKSEMGFEFRYSYSEVRNSWIMDIPNGDGLPKDNDNDAIYYWSYLDFKRPHILENSVLYKTKDDGVDYWKSIVRMSNNIFARMYEKGMSVGWGSDVIVERSLFIQNSIGLASSFGSGVKAINCTFYDNSQSILAYDWSSGSLTNCLLAKQSSLEFKYNDKGYPTWRFDHCLSDGDPNLPGEGNIFSPHGMTLPSQYDFTLSPSSMAINAGNPKSPLDPDGSIADIGVFPYYNGGGSQITINEIYYHPPQQQVGGEPREFIELINPTNNTYNLDGYRLSDAVDFVFPEGSSMKPGEIFVVCKDGFEYRNLDCQVFEWSNGDLSNGGETVVLQSNLGIVIDQVTYSDSDPWPTQPDGLGYSLSLKNPSLDNSLAANWTASYLYQGTPGRVNLEPEFDKLKFNEITVNSLTQTDTLQTESWVEMYYHGLSPINIGGLFVTSDPAIPNMWEINKLLPKQTWLNNGDYAVFTFSSLESDDPYILPESLLNGSKIYLFRKVKDSYIKIDEMLSHPSVIETYGRYPDGADQTLALGGASRGAPNSLGSKYMISPKLIKSGEYLPVVVTLDTLDGLNPEIITGPVTLTATDGVGISSPNINMVKGRGSVTTRVDATNDFRMEIPEFDDSVRIKVVDYRTIWTVYQSQEYDYVMTPEYDYYLDDDFTIDIGRKMVIQPGVRILISKNSKFIVDGQLEILGTAENPVVFMPVNWSEPWGALEFGQSAQPSQINYCFFINGAGDTEDLGHSHTQAVIKNSNGAHVTLDHCFIIDNVGKGIYSNKSFTHIQNSLISRCDAGIESYNGTIEIGGSSILYIPNEQQVTVSGKEHDGIYLADNSNTVLSNATIDHTLMAYTTDDGLDILSDVDVSVSHSTFYHNGDKGISVIGSVVNGDHLLFDQLSIGVGAQEAGYATIDHSVFYKNSNTVRSYTSDPNVGHGHVVLTNSIFSSSESIDLFVESGSSADASYCLSDKQSISGTGNLFADPMFVEPNAGNFQLLGASPAINHGDPLAPLDPDGSRTDMGLYYYNRAVSPSGLLINEIHYHPSSDYVGYEFVELYNPSETSLDISGFSISGDIAFLFPSGTSINAYEYIVVAKDGELFQSLNIRTFTWNSGNLPDNGGTVQIVDKDGLMVDEVMYGINQGWSYWPAGNGPSLELINTDLDNSSPFSWRSSYYINGTPGRANIQSPVDGLFINEIMARNASYYPTEDGQYTDWLEIYNSRSYFVNLNNVFISKYVDQPGYFQIQFIDSDEAMIPPNGFKTFWLDKEPQKGPLHANFDVPGAGAYLGIYKSENGQMILLDSLSYSLLGADQSYGRLPDGGPLKDRLGTPTPNAPNRLPREKVEGVYINEILARNSHTYLNNLGEYDDWLELYNSTNSPIDVGGLFLTDHSDDLAFFQIPANRPDSTTIPANGFLLFYPTNKTRAGVRHVGFQLAGAGEFVGLTQLYQGTLHVVDSMSYPALTTDLSYGRQYDGSHVLVRFSSPTPGASNNGSSAVDPSEIDDIGIVLYPNPIHDQLTISIPAIEDPENQVRFVEIRTVFGKAVKRWDLSSQNPGIASTIQWNRNSEYGLSSGIYFVIIQTRKKVMGHRILIE